MAMSIPRMLEQNTYYFLVSGLRHLEPKYTDLNYVSGLPKDENLTLPTVSIRRNIQNMFDYETGTVVADRNENYVISVFTKTDGQRDDVSEKVKEIFDDTRTEFLDMNQGFSGGQDSLGVIFYKFLNMRVIHNLVTQKISRIDIDINAQFIYDTST